MISIVSPVYRAEKILPILVSEINLVMERIGEDYEIILVDDRSPDNSWEVMKVLSSQNPKIKSIRLSRNFGQHSAIFAGLTKTKGDWVVVMDCDMQDQPKEIAKLYKKALEGYDIVLGQRENRKDKFLKKLSSKLFYKVFNYLSGGQFNNEIGNFGIYKKKVIGSILNINDLKIKHITGEYLNLSQVEPDDVVYYIVSKNRKVIDETTVRSALVNTEDKVESYNNSIQYLLENGIIALTDGKIELL